MTGPVERIRAYHERTKHSLDRYAEGPGHLDWANQPDPFRTYAGAARHPFTPSADELDTTYEALWVPGAVHPATMNAANLGLLLELSLGLSAWKTAGGSSWALRCNPSSGNLHPTEGYLVCPAVSGLEAGVYHYASRDHSLERRARPSAGAFERALPPGCVLVGLSSIHWREAWKYGERAYRYCQHDAGHALAAVRFAAGALGWSARVLDDWPDAAVSALLGLDRDEDFVEAEREAPDLLLCVGPSVRNAPFQPLVEAALAAEWTGRANRLSADHVDWDVIDEAQEASRKSATPSTWSGEPPREPTTLRPLSGVTAARLIRQRRSAVAYDGITSLPVDRFFHILDRLMPRDRTPPFDAMPWPPRIHPAFFVHRVDGLEPGLYVLPRRTGVEALVRHALAGRDWAWDKVDRCPAHIPLRCLATGDLRRPAKVLSCLQDIAGESAFSLGMLAEFEEALSLGAWWYRRLFWEAGALGQTLYLEAEAAGLRGTGIGCYFDDEVHRLLGLEGTTFQSLYHFTVGGPLEDTRLTTLPPYGHLLEE